MDKKKNDVNQPKILAFPGGSRGRLPKVVSLALELIPSKHRFVLRRSFEFSTPSQRTNENGHPSATSVSELQSQGLNLLSEEVDAGGEVTDEQIDESLRALRGHKLGRSDSDES